MTDAAETRLPDPIRRTGAAQKNLRSAHRQGRAP